MAAAIHRMSKWHEGKQIRKSEKTQKVRRKRNIGLEAKKQEIELQR